MGEHDGHRERMRKLFDENAESMTDAQLLELLLYYSIPRRDVRPLAESILERTGGLAGFQDMDTKALRELPGVGSSTEKLLTLTAEAARRTASGRRCGAVITSPEEALRQLKPRLRGVEGNIAFALYLDERMRVVACMPVDVTVKELAWQAAGFDSRAIVVGVSYEDGRCTPDVAEARNVGLLRESLRTLEITLLDYIIVGSSHYTSLYIDRILRADESMRTRYRSERDSSRVSTWSQHFTLHELPPELMD